MGTSGSRRALSKSLGIFFISAGALHFIIPAFYLRMMPPIFPMPLFWVYLTGAAEILLGVLVLTGRHLRIARWGLLALLICVFPANLYMASHGDLFSEFSQTGLYLRLPFQFLFIAWVWYGTAEPAQS